VIAIGKVTCICGSYRVYALINIMNESLIIILFIGVFGAIGVALVVQHFKRKGSEWSGTVIDKDVHENVRNNTTSRHSNLDNRSGVQLGTGGPRFGMQNQSHVTLSYSIRVNTSDGKEIKWPISEGLYQQIDIGDQLQKDSGTKIPRITQKAQEQTAQQPQA
jgi:regulatory protein YycI of two-component signal transduction system YycFG